MFNHGNVYRGLFSIFSGVRQCSTCNGTVSGKAMRIQLLYSYVNLFFKEERHWTCFCAPAAFQFSVVLLSLKSLWETELEWNYFL